MARFDWKAAVVQKAVECEGALMARGMFPESQALVRDAEKAAGYARWLCRSYCRKGMRKVVSGSRA
ncbi:MAG: hypothetical protein ACREPE_11820 [Lysobacter sp.]